MTWSKRGRTWTQAELDTLLELAGTRTLPAIARQLDRSTAACASKLHRLQTRARDAQGALTAPDCAKAYSAPIDRVYRLIRNGTLRAHRGPGGSYWQIDPDSAERCPELRAPKRTHKTSQPDRGDYLQRYPEQRARYYQRAK